MIVGCSEFEKVTGPICCTSCHEDDWNGYQMCSVSSTDDQHEADVCCRVASAITKDDVDAAVKAALDKAQKA